MVLKYLLEKEFKQFFRNKFMPVLTVVFPLIVMLVMPWAATLDIKNIEVATVDHDRSSYSRQLIEKIEHSSYFNLSSLSPNYREGMRELEYGRAELILEIPSGFENEMVNFGYCPVQISVNAVNSIKGMMGQAYIMALLSEFSEEKTLKAEYTGEIILPKADVASKSMYNPTLDYQKTMIPGLIMVIMIVLCGFLPAVNIVIEKERGTIEQLNVTPMSKLNFVLAKLIPFWIIGLVSLSIAFFLSWLVYDLVPVGNLLTLYLFSGLFILIMTGLGVVISNNSSTVQQATFVMFFFVIINIMMCGLMTPVKSMPDWAQVIAAFTPTKYMVNVLRSVYLKGSGIADLSTDLVALLLMVIFFNVWALLSYRKTK